MKIEKIIKQKLYPQRCSATPIHLSSAGGSAFDIPQPEGLEYSVFVYLWQNEDGVISYLWDDLVRLNSIIRSRLASDSKFYEKLKQRYESDWQEAIQLYEKIESTDLKSLGLDELTNLAVQASHCTSLSVGVGHMIEPYAMVSDERIRKEVQTAVKDTVLANKVFISKTTPQQPSFASEAQEALRNLAEGKEVLDEDINHYIKNFFWLQNTYSGRKTISKADVLRMVEEYRLESKKLAKADIRAESYVVPQFNLPDNLAFELELLSYLSVWQDERKRNILIAIDYMERIMEAIGEKVGISITLLRYLTSKELKSDIKSLEAELQKRRSGAVMVHTKEGFEFGFGELFETHKSSLNEGQNNDLSELRGSSASVGKAMGRVKVCLNADNLDKVKDGDILVTSMTRPEYLPAMRRAGAFVTDEGGITCHVAIVAREMKKPCVIGTKFATRFLKDNDLVEVRANHGIVVVLEKSDGK